MQNSEEKNIFGFVIIDKPRGITSHDCVYKLRKILGLKRIGHGGTLDPDVTGVLPLALGQATRLLRFLPGEKTYRGVIQLGKNTTTDDLSGNTLSSHSWPELNTTSLQKILNQFIGEIQQKPPQISSVHFKGERAYQRARRGEVMNLPFKTITIHELKILQWSQAQGQLEIDIRCSSGTYIRALARDLGNKLNCGGCLARLRRTEALGFNEKDAHPLPNSPSDAINLYKNVLKPISALSHLPRLRLKNLNELKLWRTGSEIAICEKQIECAPNPKIMNGDNVSPEVLVIDLDEEVAGIAIHKNKLVLQPKVVFNAN